MLNRSIVKNLLNLVVIKTSYLFNNNSLLDSFELKIAELNSKNMLDNYWVFGHIYIKLKVW